MRLVHEFSVVPVREKVRGADINAFRESSEPKGGSFQLFQHVAYNTWELVGFRVCRLPG